MTNRKMIYEADEMFPNRWSPRKFADKKVDKEDLLKMVEAARWAPSSFNAQPYYFYCGFSEEGRSRVFDSLVEANQKWAKDVPVLMYLVAEKLLKRNGKENKYARFDAGAAWVSLALQANKLGLVTHAMAGFIHEKAYEVTGLSPDEFDIVAAIAVAYPEEEPTETPTPRKKTTDELIQFH